MSRMACAWISDSPKVAIRPVLASAVVFDARIRVITASRLSRAMRRPFEDVGAGLGLAQLELDPPADHLAAELDEVLDHLEQRQHPRPAGDDRQHDDAEGLLELGVLVEVVEDDLADLAALQLDDDAHAVAVGLVADVGNALDGLVADQVGDALDQLGLVDLVGDLAR